MKRYFTPTFYKFFFAFVVIIVVAFAVMGTVAVHNSEPVDNVAHTQ